jgi:hypothetical protein
MTARIIRMSFSAFFIILLPFFLAVLADDIHPVNINLFRNTWRIEALNFNRNFSHYRDGSKSPLDVHFRLYHPKFEPCTITEKPQAGYLRGDQYGWAAEFQDPEFCMDWKMSNRAVICDFNGTDSLWRPCSGRHTITSSCGNMTEPINLGLGSGCTNFTESEDESERPWVKWSVLSLDEPNDPGPNKTQYGWTVDPARPFHSITIKIISGQRLVVGVQGL